MPLARQAVLDRVVFFRFGGARDGQPQVAEFHAQGLPGDPQQESGLLEIPTRVLQDARQQEPVHLPVRLRVQIANIRGKPLANDNPVGTGPRPG